MCQVSFAVCPRCANFHRVRMIYCPSMRETLSSSRDRSAEWAIRTSFCWSPLGDCDTLTVAYGGHFVYCADHARSPTGLSAHQIYTQETEIRRAEYERAIRALEQGESSGGSTATDGAGPSGSTSPVDSIIGTLQ